MLHNCFITLSINALSSSLKCYGLIKNGDLSVTSISALIFWHVPISTLKLKAFLYLYSMPISSFLSSLVKYKSSKCMYLSSISLSVMCLHSSLGSNHGYFSFGNFCSLSFFRMFINLLKYSQSFLLFQTCNIYLSSAVICLA